MLTLFPSSRCAVAPASSNTTIFAKLPITNPMKPLPQQFTVIIPAEIVAFNDLTLSERVILGHLLHCPQSNNATLASLTWLGEAGVASLLRRLYKRGHLLKKVVGGCRYLVVQDVDTDTYRGESHDTHPNDSCDLLAETVPESPSKAVRAVNKLMWFTVGIVDAKFRARDWLGSRLDYETCIERVTKVEGLVPKYRAIVLDGLRHSVNYLFALEHLAPAHLKMSASDVEGVMSMLDRAPRAKLLEFRRRVESGAALLGPVQEVLELAQAGETVPSQPTGQASTQAPSQPVAPDPDPDDPDDTESDDLD